jgi:DNA-directed RNA polymerase sigma subunit (sigma70/sigma32)
MAIPGINKLRARTLLAEPNRQADGPTDAELAQQLGISKSRVYQLRLRAIAKIRRAVLDDPELRQLAVEVCGREVE